MKGLIVASVFLFNTLTSEQLSAAQKPLSNRLIELQDSVDQSESFQTLASFVQALIEEQQPEIAIQYLNLLNHYLETPQHKAQYWLLSGQHALLQGSLCNVQNYLTKLQSADFVNTFSALLIEFRQHQQDHGIDAQQLSCLVNKSRSVLKQRGLVRSPSIYLYINFDTDSDRLSHAGLQQVNALAKGLMDIDLSEFVINVVGHADRRGDEDYNQALSERRALRIKQSLTDLAPTLSLLIRSSGLGEFEPLVNENSESAYTLNRRVELYLSKKEDTDGH